MYDILRVVETVAGIEMLDNHDAVIFEEPVAFVVLHCSRRRVKRLPIDLKDAPLAVAADKKISFSVPASVLCGQSRDAIG